MKKHHFAVKGQNGENFKAATLVPTPNPSAGKNTRRTAKAEFTADYLSGKGHAIPRGDAKKLETAMNHMQAYFQKHWGMKDSWKGIGQKQWDAYIEYIKHGTSLICHHKVPIHLGDKTQKDVYGFSKKVLIAMGKEELISKETYKAQGIDVGREDLESPIDFPSDHSAKRDAVQDLLEKCKLPSNTYYPVVSELGRAFGLRLAERMASRDLLVRRGDKLYASYNLGPMRKVSVPALQKRYGNSFVDRLIDKKTGQPKTRERMRYLIVEDAKQDRNRIQGVNNAARVAAIERLHHFIWSSPGRSKHMKAHPDRQNPEQAKAAYSKFLKRHGIERGTELHSHGDRHFEAQRIFNDCIELGMSVREAANIIIDELGHEPGSDKHRYYVDVDKYR